ncbi:MAG: hypothetical protein KKD99_02700 [Proteobacteria bacterium]|nr:hypothetical protein [Pseudomonadota bacterium]MBU4447471.1 hypothetical protein [Pseudomonadota bacterium]
MKRGVKEVCEHSKEYRKLIADAIPGLDKVHIIGTMLSKSERPDVAYAGGVIEELVYIIGREFCSAVPDHDHDQFQRDIEIPF